MNKLNLTPTQLMHELESVEESLIKPTSVHLTKSFVKPKGKPKGGNKNKKKKDSSSSYQINWNEEAKRQVF